MFKSARHTMDEAEQLLAEQTQQPHPGSTSKHGRQDVEDHSVQRETKANNDTLHSTELSWKVVFGATLVALGGVLFGYDVGIISGAILQLEEDFVLSPLEKELVVSLMLLGAMVASMVGGFVIDALSRKWSIVLNAVIFLLGAILLATAKSFAMLIIARIVVGFAVSLSAIAEVVYISEVAPPKHRGLLVSLNELGITGGIMLAYIVNYALIETQEGWRIMFAISAAPAILQGIGMVFLPQSPRWLLLKGQLPKARASLISLRAKSATTDQIDTELGAMDRVIAAEARRPFSALFRSPSLRRGLLLGCALTLLQQLTGQPNILYYGTTVFKAAGFETNKQAALANTLLGGVKVFATILALWKVDKLGRRLLLLIGCTIMVASLLVLASVTVAFPPISPSNGTNTTTTTGMTTTISTTMTSSLTATMSSTVTMPSTGTTTTTLTTTAVPTTAASLALSDVHFANNAVKWTSLGAILAFVIAYAFRYCIADTDIPTRTSLISTCNIESSDCVPPCNRFSLCSVHFLTHDCWASSGIHRHPINLGLLVPDSLIAECVCV
eukprot:m.250387 g.250387  ORF g.250387 m.250387 type:complete len:556 (-) comp15433_c0_seq34:22-1689(-)